MLLNHHVDEGEFQNYLGMHQWNICARDGHLVIWDRERAYDISDRLRGRTDAECRLYSGDGNQRDRLHAIITKHAH